MLEDVLNKRDQTRALRSPAVDSVYYDIGIASVANATNVRLEVLYWTGGVYG